MLTFFRRFFKSKLGLGLTLAFLGLIAFAFASSDVANTGTFGGVAGGERVAVVGDAKIGTAELSRSASAALDRLRQQDPTLSMQSLVAQGGLNRVLDQLIDRYAIATYAQENGLRAGNNLINSEIRQIPAFRGADGNFSADTYQQALAIQNLTDAMVRDDMQSGLLAQLALSPGEYGAVMPQKLASRYAQLFKERRIGGIAFLPSAAFAPSGAPTDEQLQAFYQSNRSEFIRPERRVVRYASFGSEAVEGAITPTEAEIAARYEQDSELYAESEERRLTQLIVPTEQAATALREQVSGGASFEQVAASAGLRTSQIGPVNQAELENDSSAAVANAYFDAAQGALSAPARSSLGWHIARVDDVTRNVGRSLDEVRSDIAATLREEKRVRALADLAAEIEEELDSGATLSSIAEATGLEIQTTRAITADGSAYGALGERAPDVLTPALATIFQMEESEPQVAEVVRGETFLAYEVSDITQSAAAPLNEIRDTVVARWRLSEGAKEARAAAERVLERVSGDATLSAAVGAEEASIPPIEQINLTREQLAQRQARVTAPLALLFSMAQGTTKRLSAGNDLGWFIVDLDRIEVGEIDPSDPLIAQARAQLGPAVGQEYTQQLVASMRAAMGTERNPAAIEAVRKQLLGER